MGGNIFPNLVRLNKREYLNLEQRILSLFQGGLISPIPFYRQKESFGDLDLLHHLDALTITKVMQDHFVVCGIHSNGPVLSFAIRIDNDRDFQIDFIFISKQCFNFALSYFSYNDLGNFLGKVYHRAGFKLGHEGLKYVIRADDKPNYTLKEITLTTDWSTALGFMHYDPIRFNKGFDTLEEMFGYVLSSPFAKNINLFLLEKLDHKSRIRDRKRKNYHLFVEWFKKQNLPTPFALDNSLNREKWKNKAFEYFPGFKEQYDNVQQDYEISKQVKTRFNGELIRELTGLEGKQLGTFIQQFLQQLNMNKNEWVLQHSDLEISREIKRYFENER